MRGGVTSAYGVDPQVGIAVEVGHATDYPDIDKRKHGEAICGDGPIIARGPNINPALFELLVKAADKAKVAYQLGAEPRGTGTDANAIQLSRGGKVAASHLDSAALHAHADRGALAQGPRCDGQAAHALRARPEAEH